MTEQVLVTELRKLIEDENSVDYTEAQLKTYLNQHRLKLTDITMVAEDATYLVFFAPVGNLMDVVLTDANDVVLTPSSSDVLNGIFTFSTEQGTVIINCTAHQLKQTAYEIWILNSQRTHFSGDVKLGDETIPQDKNNAEYCLKKAYAIKPSRTNLQIERGVNG